MARQSTTPVQFEKSRRGDTGVLMSSGRAGKVVPAGYIPVLRGDSLSGAVGIDVELAEMPRPLLNGVQLNAQAWFVPKSAHPQFSGYDEFMASYQKKPIKTLGVADRTPPSFFQQSSGAAVAGFANSDLFKTLGVHLHPSDPINHDLINSFVLINNFRLAAHSSKLPRRSYGNESTSVAGGLPRAFWPSGRFSRVVPDYERALIVGSLDLDVQAGRVPVVGIGLDVPTGTPPGAAAMKSTRQTGRTASTINAKGWNVSDGGFQEVGNNRAVINEDPNRPGYPSIWAEMAGEDMTISLAQIDKARTTQAFANLRTAYAGNDPTGFSNDDAIVAELMQGFRVPEDQFNRPWLLDSKRVGFGFQERHATDAANLDASVTQGRASVRLSLNLPQQDVGGMIIFTLEVVPERIYERQEDHFHNIIDTDKLPDALRDIQRAEPVDMVLNRRLDAKHATPNGLYGYEPMNDIWNREFTRLGGAFYQATPGAAWTEQRSAIWMAETVNPTYTADHFLVPQDFPHDVFSDTQGPAFEFVARHAVSVSGLTQIGDVLAENNDDYSTVEQS